MTKRIPPRVYADAPLFYNVIKRERGLWAGSLKVLLAAQRGDIKLVASTLLLAEVIGHRGDVIAGVRDDVIDRYLSDIVEWVELDLFVVREAHKLGDQYNLRGPDASHLATAVRRKVDYFMSRDGAFPYGQTVNGVRVVDPTIVWDPCLDDEEVNRLAAEEESALQAAEADRSTARKKVAVRHAAAVSKGPHSQVTVEVNPSLNNSGPAVVSSQSLPPVGPTS